MPLTEIKKPGEEEGFEGVYQQFVWDMLSWACPLAVPGAGQVGSRVYGAGDLYLES